VSVTSHLRTISGRQENTFPEIRRLDRRRRTGTFLYRMII